MQLPSTTNLNNVPQIIITMHPPGTNGGRSPQQPNDINCCIHQPPACNFPANSSSLSNPPASNAVLELLQSLLAYLFGGRYGDGGGHGGGGHGGHGGGHGGHGGGHGGHGSHGGDDVHHHHHHHHYHGNGGGSGTNNNTNSGEGVRATIHSADDTGNYTGSPETHKKVLDELRSKAGKDMNLQDLDEIANGNWSKYNGTLSTAEVDAAKAFRANDYKLSREVDQNGNKNGLLDDETKSGNSVNAKNWGKSKNFEQAKEGMMREFGGPHGLVKYIKEKAGTGDEWLEPRHVRKAADIEQDPEKKAILEYFYGNFGAIDQTKGKRHGADPRANGTDGKIGAGDIQKHFGLPGGPDEAPWVTYDEAKSNTVKIFGSIDGLMDYIKENGGSTNGYVSPSNVRSAIDKTPDDTPENKEIRRYLEFYWGHFGDIDKKAGQEAGGNGKDGLIASGDINAYFHW